jgi:hypothetical protein
VKTTVEISIEFEDLIDALCNFEMKEINGLEDVVTDIDAVIDGKTFFEIMLNRKNIIELIQPFLFKNFNTKNRLVDIIKEKEKAQKRD